MVKYPSLLKIENQLVKAFYHHKSIGIIFLPISITPDNLTAIGPSVLELLSKIAKFDLLTSDDKLAILDRALSQINRGDLLTHIDHC